MVDELFVGIARAPGGVSGRCVCVDGLGRPVQEFSLAWAPARLRHVLLWFQDDKRNQGLDVTVGVEAEDLDDEMAAVFAESPLLAKGVERGVVDGMFDCLRLKQRTVRSRARCIAQLLLLADYPPVSLKAKGASSLARW
jgi:hypothetical protein